MKIIGSQRRETLQEAGYTLVKRLPHREIVLEDDSGKQELWAENDHFAGYVVEVNGKGYEFVRGIAGQTDDDLPDCADETLPEGYDVADERAGREP